MVQYAIVLLDDSFRRLHSPTTNDLVPNQKLLHYYRSFKSQLDSVSFFLVMRKASVFKEEEKPI